MAGPGGRLTNVVGGPRGVSTYLLWTAGGGMGNVQTMDTGGLLLGYTAAATGSVSYIASKF